MVFHRPIPTGFKVKTGTIIREADGWHISLTLKDKTVPVMVEEIQPTDENTLGIDLGITNTIKKSVLQSVLQTVTSHQQLID
jgi:putative transposase